MAKVYFYYSAMNAGKSTVLLQSSYNYQERGMDTLLFAPNFDTRFGDPAIYSRIGIKQSATLYEKDFDFFRHTSLALNTKNHLACLLIDEAHFLTKLQTSQLVHVAKKLNIPVLCYGLRSDFLGNPFEGSIYLLAWAEKLIEIKTICFCGKKATMNMRIDSNGNPVKTGSQIQIGGNESYASVCLNHFIEKVGPLNTHYLNEKINDDTTASTK